MKYRTINKSGFTLVELMITVVIIGILGAVAVPAYQDYTVRSQVAEGFSLASGLKVSIEEYYANFGYFPDDISEVGVNSIKGKYVDSVEIVEDGVVVATFGNQANNYLLSKSLYVFSIANMKENLEWHCFSDIDKKYLPIDCSGEINKIPENPNDLGNSQPEDPLLNNNLIYDSYDQIYFVDGELFLGMKYTNHHMVDENGVMYFTINNPYDIDANWTAKLYPDGTLEEERWHPDSMFELDDSIPEELREQYLKYIPTNDEPYEILVTYPQETHGANLDRLLITNAWFSDLSEYHPLPRPILREENSKYEYLIKDSSGYDVFEMAQNQALEQNDPNMYYSFINTWKTQMDTFKAQNGGSFPSDFPKSYLDIYNDNYTQHYNY